MKLVSVSEVLFLLLIRQISQTLSGTNPDMFRLAVKAVAAAVLPDRDSKVQSTEEHTDAVAAEHSNDAPGVLGSLVGAERLRTDEVSNYSSVSLICSERETGSFMTYQRIQ
jgi:hypothetical protein